MARGYKIEIGDIMPEISMSDITNYWAEITVVGGSLGAAALWLRRYLRDNDKTVLARELSYTARTEARLLSAEAKIDELTQIILNLRIEASALGVPPLEVISTILRADNGVSMVKVREPRPHELAQWRCVAVSYAYARQFLTTGPEQYIGKLDNEVWPQHVADEFNRNDERVHIMRQGENIREHVEGGPNGATGMFIGRKFPFKIKGDPRDFIWLTGRFEAGATV